MKTIKRTFKISKFLIYHKNEISENTDLLSKKLRVACQKFENTEKCLFISLYVMILNSMSMNKYTFLFFL